MFKLHYDERTKYITSQRRKLKNERCLLKGVNETVGTGIREHESYAKIHRSLAIFFFFGGGGGGTIWRGFVFKDMRSRVEVLKLIRLSNGCYDRIPVRKQQSINSIFFSRV